MNYSYESALSIRLLQPVVAELDTKAAVDKRIKELFEGLDLYPSFNLFYEQEMYVCREPAVVKACRIHSLHKQFPQLIPPFGKCNCCVLYCEPYL